VSVCADFGVSLFVGKKWYQIILVELDILLGLIEGKPFEMKLEVTIIIGE
jgi:hypothetical protein